MNSNALVDAFMAAAPDIFLLGAAGCNSIEAVAPATYLWIGRADASSCHRFSEPAGVRGACTRLDVGDGVRVRRIRRRGGTHTALESRGHDRILLRPRVLRDVAAVDTKVTLLGRELPFPILLAPSAYLRVLHPDGEIETARGAGAAGITLIVSMVSVISIPLERDRLKGSWSTPPLRNLRCTVAV
jgi:FMN-dependent dehydrogenase